MQNTPREGSWEDWPDRSPAAPTGAAVPVGCDTARTRHSPPATAAPPTNFTFPRSQATASPVHPEGAHRGGGRLPPYPATPHRPPAGRGGGEGRPPPPPPPRPRRARRTPALRRPRCPPPRPTPPRPRTHILTPLALPPPLSVAAVVAAAAASSSCGGCCCGGGCGCCCCCCGGGWLAAAASSAPRCGAAAAASGLSFSAISWPGRGPATAGFEKGPERLGLAAPGRPSLARTGLAAGRGRAGRLCALPW